MCHSIQRGTNETSHVQILLQQFTACVLAENSTKHSWLTLFALHRPKPSHYITSRQQTLSDDIIIMTDYHTYMTDRLRKPT